MECSRHGEMGFGRNGGWLFKADLQNINIYGCVQWMLKDVMNHYLLLHGTWSEFLWIQWRPDDYERVNRKMLLNHRSFIQGLVSKNILSSSALFTGWQADTCVQNSQTEYQILYSLSIITFGDLKRVWDRYIYLLISVLE